MTIKIIRIDGEFAIVELESKIQKVCPVEIFPDGTVCGDIIRIQVMEEK